MHVFYSPEGETERNWTLESCETSTTPQGVSGYYSGQGAGGLFKGTLIVLTGQYGTTR